MPAKNVKKSYVENSFYHLYNRTVAGSLLFQDEADYLVMLELLKKYLDQDTKFNLKSGLANPMNLSDQIELLVFCLLPNHFHFLVKQKGARGITVFARRILTSYAMYFSHKYNHHGSLFEGKLKGALIENEPYLLHLSRYIHQNPLKILQGSGILESYQYSSYPYYLGIREAKWIKADTITNIFLNAKKDPLYNFSSYKEFVEHFPVDSGSVLGTLKLED